MLRRPEVEADLESWLQSAVTDNDKNQRNEIRSCIQYLSQLPSSDLNRFASATGQKRLLLVEEVILLLLSVSFPSSALATGCAHRCPPPNSRNTQALRRFEFTDRQRMFEQQRYQNQIDRIRELAPWLQSPSPKSSTPKSSKPAASPVPKGS